MSFQQPTLFCRYRYDPLDRLINHTQPGTPSLQRFYCKKRLVTEIQGAMQHSIVQHGDQLLAQQQSKGDAPDTTLLITDQQRSVLQTLKFNHPGKSIAYSPYGHRPVENGLLSLLGFSGERPDPVTGHYLLGNGYRAFNPVLMRFNSPDSFSPFGRGGLNSYAYCVGDPINFYDPTGESGIGVVANILRWRARAALKMSGRAKLALEVAKTNTIELYGRTLTLRPGVTPVQAVKARADIMYINKYLSRMPNKDAKFYDDLTRARRESEFLGTLTGVSVTERLKLLNYIKIKPYETGRRQLSAFSSKRLDDAARGKFEPNVPLGERPNINVSKKYEAEMYNAPDPNKLALENAAQRIRSNHFIEE